MSHVDTFDAQTTLKGVVFVADPRLLPLYPAKCLKSAPELGLEPRTIRLTGIKTLSRAGKCWHRLSSKLLVLKGLRRNAYCQSQPTADILLLPFLLPRTDMPKRTSHPGVTLIKPKPGSAHTSWRARYTDPDSNRVVWKRLDPVAYADKEARRDWAKRMAKRLAARRAEIEDGAPRATGTTIEEGWAQYVKAHPHARPRTIKNYEDSFARLKKWADDAGIRTLDDLTRARLLRWRDAMIALPKRTSVKAAKRGTYTDMSTRRSAVSVNHDLIEVRVVLGWLADRDLLPRCSRDDLRRALKRLRTDLDDVEFMRSNGLEQTLNAALRHDAEMYTETRAEHAGLGIAGTTPRYTQIAPFVAVMLATGMRFNEGLTLRWTQVDLTSAHPAITLRAKDVKIGRSRTIDLRVIPCARAILAALKLSTTGELVFGLSRDEAIAAKRRMASVYGAPELFGWQVLRRSCSAYYCQWRSPWESSKQLGHSVQIAETRYARLRVDVPENAQNLEEAMGIVPEMRDVLARIDMRHRLTAAE